MMSDVKSVMLSQGVPKLSQDAPKLSQGVPKPSQGAPTFCQAYCYYNILNID